MSFFAKSNCRARPTNPFLIGPDPSCVLLLQTNRFRVDPPSD
jgi:hypothetical protein